MENRFYLKAPHRVEEEEFTKHLNKVVKGSFVAKRQILDYYEEMKLIDKRYGKNLTAESFGRGGIDKFEFYDYCDQAKNLFLTEEQKILDEKSQGRFLRAAKNSTKEDRKRLATVREKEQDRIFETTLPPIGFADLFRYQFVNFVDEIELIENIEREKVGGSVNISENRLKIYDFTEKDYLSTDQTKFSYQKTWRHELTHIMAIKTEDNCKYKYLTPMFFRIHDGTTYKAPYRLMTSPNDTQNPKALELFRKGAVLVVEIATDFFTQKVVGNRELSWAESSEIISKTEHSPCRFDIYMKSKNIPNTLFANTTYLPYGCVINAVMAFSKEKPPFILTKKYPPTYRLQEIVFKFLKEGTLSSDLEKTLNERLNFLTNIDIKLLEEGHLLEKFLMVLGEAFNGINQSSDSKNGEYNQDTYLAQAILLDLEHNYFKNKIIENSKKYDGSLAHKQKLYKEIRREITDALYMDPWVIKPNKKLGNAEKSTLARDGLSACAQVKYKDENLAIQVWAEYLQTLASYTYKFAPHLLEEYPFLKKELAGKQPDLKKLKQKETGLWL